MPGQEDPAVVVSTRSISECYSQLHAGPADGPGEEPFKLPVCSPGWLAERCQSGEPVSGLHHVSLIAGTHTSPRAARPRRVASDGPPAWPRSAQPQPG